MKHSALALVLLALPLTGCFDLLIPKSQPAASTTGAPGSPGSGDSESVATKASKKIQKPNLEELIGKDPDTQNIARLAALKPGMTRAEVDAILPGANGKKNAKDAFVEVPLDEPGVDHVQIYFRSDKAASAKVVFSKQVSTDALWEELVALAIEKYGDVEDKEKKSDRIYFSQMNSSISKAKNKQGHEIEFQLDDNVSNPAPRDLEAIFGKDKNKVPKLLENLKQGMTIDEVAKIHPSVASEENAKQKFKDIRVDDVGGVRALKLYFPKDKLEGVGIIFRRSAGKPADWDALHEFLVTKYGKAKKDDHVSWSKPKMSISASDRFFDEFEILFH